MSEIPHHPEQPYNLLDDELLIETTPYDQDLYGHMDTLDMARKRAALDPTDKSLETVAQEAERRLRAYITEMKYKTNEPPKEEHP